MLEKYPDILDVKDIQKILKIGRGRSYNLINEGKIEYIRVGNCIRIPKESLIEYIKNHKIHLKKPGQ